MRDFGFIKEYVKGLGVIGTYARTYVPRGYSVPFVPLVGLIRTVIRTDSYRHPCYSHASPKQFDRRWPCYRRGYAYPRAATPYGRERSV
jgi:hypothetical protein